MQYRRLIVQTSVALALAGCSTLAEPDRVAEPGLLLYYGFTSQVLAPDSVNRGEPFEVRFRTFAGGCTREIAATRVDLAPGVIEVRPFNWRRTANICTADLLFLDHRATVRVAGPGVVTIRVRGERQGGPPGTPDGPVELTRQLIVR